MQVNIIIHIFMQYEIRNYRTYDIITALCQGHCYGRVGHL